MFASRIWPATRTALAAAAAAAAAHRRVVVPRPAAPPEHDRPGRHMTDRHISAHAHVDAHVDARAPPRGNSARRTHEAHAAARGRAGQGGGQHAHRKRRLTLGDHDRDPHAGDRVRGPVHVHAPHPGRPHTAREAAMAGIAPTRNFPAVTRALRRTVPAPTRPRITVSRDRQHWGHVNGPG